MAIPEDWKPLKSPHRKRARKGSTVRRAEALLTESSCAAFVGLMAFWEKGPTETLREALRQAAKNPLPYEGEPEEAPMGPTAPPAAGIGARPLSSEKLP